MLPLYQDPHFTFRFAEDRLIPRFHLEGVEAWNQVAIFKIDPDTGSRLALLATATVGGDGWVNLAEPIIVRAGEAFIAVPEPARLNHSPGMVSIYQSEVQAYGQRWHRPWSVLVLCMTLLLAMHWLTRPKPEEIQVVCQDQPGSRFRVAVDINGLMWTAELDAALACALKHGRQVLLAFHGVTDTNALINERNVFCNLQIKSAIRRYVLLMLYIDSVPPQFYQQKPTQQDQQSDGQANMNFEKQTFQTHQEPLYVVLQPKANGKFEIVAAYDEGLIRDTAGFAGFLQNPLEAAQERKYKWKNN